MRVRNVHRDLCPYLVSITLLLLVEIIAVSVLDSITISVGHQKEGGWWRSRLSIGWQWSIIFW